MDTPATILIATDSVTDAELVKDLLKPEFGNIVTSTDPDKLPGDFTHHRPGVLILAFDSMEKSERHYLGLYRLCEAIHQHPHRTVILCNKDEVKRAYELCKKEYFDDYNLFWPMTYDMSRLAMSIHHALRELVSLKTDGPSVTEFAAQARHLTTLEKTLDQQIVQGGHHIEAVSQVIEQAEQKIGTALDVFSQRLISDSLSGSGAIKNADAIKEEISRFKREEVQQHFRAAAESAQPLKQWAHDFKQECEPLMKSARILNAMADHIRPVVLVVDDDEFQRKIIGKLLEAESYQLVFASDGFEALNILRKTWPDIILMDVMMPGMDGMETMRRLKAAPQSAKIPVVMVTSKSEGKVVVDSRKAGAVDFVVKPFDRATLVAKIAHVLSASASS